MNLFAVIIAATSLQAAWMPFAFDSTIDPITDEQWGMVITEQAGSRPAFALLVGCYSAGLSSRYALRGPGRLNRMLDVDIRFDDDEPRRVQGLINENYLGVNFTFYENDVRDWIVQRIVSAERVAIRLHASTPETLIIEAPGASHAFANLEEFCAAGHG
jgi:hypothetical protein